MTGRIPLGAALLFTLIAILPLQASAMNLQGDVERVPTSARANNGHHRQPSPRPSASPWPTPAPSPTVTPGTSVRLYGTLESIPSKSAEEYAAGVRLAHVGVPWDAYEPQDDVFSSNEIAYQRQKIATLRANGMKIVLGLGLHHPPSWVLALPHSRYVNQYGVAAGGLPNLTWNPLVRAKAEEFVTRAIADLGLAGVWAIRIQAGKYGEVLLPPETDAAGHGNSYWGFDEYAQSVTPLPGWVPGDMSVSTERVREWIDWYVRSMADNVNWQISLYRRLGFAGWLHVLLPGQGVRPGSYEMAIANWLSGPGDENHTLGSAAVWHKIIDGIVDRAGVVIDISSLADGSSNDDLCGPADASVAINDPIVSTWSSARWIAYNARRYGMPTIGENPSRSDSTYTTYGIAMMEAAARQMLACGLQGLLWAHDSDLHDPTSPVTLANYGQLISAFP